MLARVAHSDQSSEPAQFKSSENRRTRMSSTESELSSQTAAEQGHCTTDQLRTVVFCPCLTGR
ncbi:hypothetical protein SynBIOSE41_03695 [Synechococcus sp. BIOS-E4-1]|nr:hypothetical protein SynBIOSE41_03695 [Synechococcus sp. BIOS-E4-1]